MKKIEDKLDKIQADVGEIKTHLAVYNSQLEIHIKRSDMLETQLEVRLAPVEKHVNMVSGAIKLISIAAMVAAIIEMIIHLK